MLKRDQVAYKAYSFWRSNIYRYVYSMLPEFSSICIKCTRCLSGPFFLCGYFKKKRCSFLRLVSIQKIYPNTQDSVWSRVSFSFLEEGRLHDQATSMSYLALLNTPRLHRV